jgi:hypothetical protein
VRQQAWLHAIPKDKQRQNAPPRVSRLQQMRRDLKDETYEPVMPPLDAGGHLVGYLWEIGPVIHGSMGSSPVTHEAIGWWKRNTGIELQPWEARFIRALSHEYLNESSRAEELRSAAPWTAPSGHEAQRAATAQGLKNSIRGLAGM